MNLDKQVVSLPLAKRLRELGAPQDSYAVWVETKNPSSGWYRWSITDDRGNDCGHGSIGCEALVLCKRGDDILDLDIYADSIYYAAYTVAELGELLPVCVEYQDETYSIDISWQDYDDRIYIVQYSTLSVVNDGEYPNLQTVILPSEDNRNFACANGNTEAEARGLMLVSLIENGYMKFEKEEIKP